MAGRGEISHKGRVISVAGGNVSVEIVSEAACASCRAASLCGMTEAEKKTVVVPAVPGEEYRPGEEVEVMLSASSGLNAVVTAYVIPLCVLVILIVALSFSGAGELVSGLVGIGGVALYYMVLYLAGGRLTGKYSFSIRRKIN